MVSGRKSSYQIQGLLIIGLFVMVSVNGQEYSYRHYTVKDGLVQNQVINIFQDSRGYIWLATNGGVSRFDGKEFINYTVNDGLLSNQVRKIFEDSQGGINFSSIPGISRLYQGKIKTTVLSDTLIDKKEMIVVPDYVPGETCILNANHNFCYSFVFDSLIRQKFIKIKDLDAETILKDTANRFWIRTRHDEIYCLTDDTLVRFTENKRCGIAKGPSGEIVIWDENHLYEPDLAEYYLRKKQDFPWNGTTILDGFDKDQNTYFKVAMKRVGIFDGRNFKFLHKEFNFINRLLIDRQDNLWIATENGFYRLITDAFENFTVGTGINKYVWSIVEDEDHNIWFASYGDGLGFWNGDRFQRVTGYKKVYNILNGLYFYTGAKRSHDQSLYFPVKDKGILRYDGRNFTMVPGLPKGSCLDVFEDTLNNRLVAASTSGIVIIENGRTPVVHEPGVRENGKYIKTIAQDKFGRYWLGGEYTLYILEGDHFTGFPNDSCDYDAGAVCIYRDHPGNLWIGTMAGLYFYNYTEFIRIAPHILKTQVSSIIERDSSRLYMGTSEGLALFDLRKFYNDHQAGVEILDASKGFQGFDCIRNGILKDSENNIWVATSERVVKFYPGKLHNDTISPEIRISSISASGKSGESFVKEFYSYTLDSVLTYPHYLQNFRFNFHAIHFYAPEKVRYAYKLEGYDDDWLQGRSDRYAVYTNLSPGKYTFMVKAQNADRRWSHLPASVPFSIKPAFWQTLSFRIGVNLLVILLFLLAGYLWMNYRRKRQRIREETERQISELQLKTIRSQMDPHFTFNALNSISSVIYKENKEKAYNYFSKFSKLVRSSLEVSDKIARTLQEEIDFTVNYLELEKLRFQDDFDFKIAIEDSIDMNTMVPKMILQNYAENAVKHGLKHKAGNRKLEISIADRNSHVEIRIEDNGIGSKAAGKMDQFSTGKGLQIMNMIYNLYYKLYAIKITQTITDLYDMQKNPAGTRVILQIPKK